MRRMAMLVALAVALLALGASAVFAQEEEQSAEEQEGTVEALNNQIIHCHGIPCYATGRNDLVYERPRNGLNDRIILRGGHDQVRANTYRRDRDVIKGGAGDDLIYVNDGDRRDRIRGGRGNDKCYVDARREAVNGCARVIVR